LNSPDQPALLGPILLIVHAFHNLVFPTVGFKRILAVPKTTRYHLLGQMAPLTASIGLYWHTQPDTVYIVIYLRSVPKPNLPCSSHRGAIKFVNSPLWRNKTETKSGQI